ncbi:Protein MS5 [Arabidopsis suecica]|uniref:Protein MS5 n=1 Tax=Arabidopsis suecica TaxID=45249 RepID=A0A8T1Y7R4_ARASU|nr:Protein MS5 [Arabidopsis suecica]
MDVVAISEFGRLEIAKSSTPRQRMKKLRAWLKKNHQLAYLGLVCAMIMIISPFMLGLVSTATIFTSDAGCTDEDTYVVDTWRIFACRPTCNKSVDDYWDRDEEIDPFYTGEMPKWFSDEALTSDNKKYYVVQETELHENEWLHLFIEIAFYSKAKTNPELVEINKVVVETKEDYITEAREKLHAENAIFYISYKYTGVSSSGLAGDHKAIIRKTMDGITEHMSLEVASEHG